MGSGIGGSYLTASIEELFNSMYLLPTMPLRCPTTSNLICSTTLSFAFWQSFRVVFVDIELFRCNKFDTDK
jgi:hypothetical protein